MKNYIFKIYYDGYNYQGFQKQPSGRAIENFVEIAFVKAGYIESLSKNRYIGASRTDSGVNANSNVFSLKCEIKPNLSYLNSFLPSDGSIIIWSYCEVNDDFNPRMNTKKHYQYFIPENFKYCFYNTKRLKDYIGTYDFSSFIKKGGAGTINPFTTIFEITIEDSDNGKYINIHGDNFGREQIRRMIGFFLQKKYQNISPKQYLKSPQKIDIKSAPPHYLTLIDIKYKNRVKWSVDSNLFYILKNLINNLKAKEDQIKLNEKSILSISKFFQSKAPI